jgi:hypothetical protein
LNITELLHKEVKIDPRHICLNITTITDIYQLCFIEHEDHEKLGVYITGDDGKERYLIIMKDQIVSLQVIYEDDIKLEIGNLETNQDVMVQ